MLIDFIFGMADIGLILLPVAIAIYLTSNFGE